MASDARGLRDLTLWETNDGGAVNFHMVRQARPCRGVPAVLRITVAEIEESKAECREALERMERAVRERDEARAERDNVSVEAHHWMGEAARYREALERIMRDEPIGVHGVPVPLDVLVAELRAIAREALGGGE